MKWLFRICSIALLVFITSCEKFQGVLAPIHYQKPSGRLAFTSGHNLYLVDPDGRNLVLLRSDVTSYWPEIKWSPNGQYLAYCSFVQDTTSSEDKEDLKIIDRFGNFIVSFADHVKMYSGWIDSEITGYDWSDDSQYLIFSIFHDRVGSCLYKYRIGEAAPIKVADTRAYVMFGDPALSPDGRAIAFVIHSQGDLFDILLLADTPSKSGFIHSGISGFNERMYLDWLDSEHLIYNNSKEGLVVIDTSGTNIQLVHPYIGRFGYSKLTTDRQLVLLFSEEKAKYLDVHTWTGRSQGFDAREDAVSGMSVSPEHTVYAIANTIGIGLLWFDGVEEQYIFKGECSDVDWTSAE